MASIRFLRFADPPYILIEEPARPTGSATATGTTVLTDVGAQFESWGVVAGDFVRNTTDGSWAKIISVDSQTQLTHEDLQDGAENDWDISEAWEVEKFVSSVTVQELITAIRNFEDEPVTMSAPKIAKAEGKTDISGGLGTKFTGLVLELLGDWRIKFADRVGPFITLGEVASGVLVPTNTGGAAVVMPSDYVFPKIEVDVSPGAVAVPTQGELDVDAIKALIQGLYPGVY